MEFIWAFEGGTIRSVLFEFMSRLESATGSSMYAKGNFLFEVVFAKR